MRTTIALDRNERGEWDEARGTIDVSHDKPLSDEALAALRALGRLVRDRVDEGDERARP